MMLPLTRNVDVRVIYVYFFQIRRLSLESKQDARTTDWSRMHQSL